MRRQVDSGPSRKTAYPLDIVRDTLMNMIGNSGNPYWTLRSIVFYSVDFFLVVMGVILAAYIRFWLNVDLVFKMEYLVTRIVFFGLVIQTFFYYFDMHDINKFRNTKRLAGSLAASLVTATLFLTFMYYVIPFLTIGRGIYALSLILIFPMAFSWRFFYAWILNGNAFRERILIIGTGDLARKIKKEIVDTGQNNIDIIGFVAEGLRNESGENESSRKFGRI
jgi:FlaA1/EpsC-like NDP-sugar epimerase